MHHLELTMIHYILHMLNYVLNVLYINIDRMFWVLRKSYDKTFLVYTHTVHIHGCACVCVLSSPPLAVNTLNVLGVPEI